MKTKQGLLAFLIIGFLMLVLTLVSLNQDRGGDSRSKAATQSAQLIGYRTKTANCLGVSGLPDAACTPGAVFPTATKEQVCQKGYSASVRDVSENTKKQVYLEYGITSHYTGEYEVDHLISLELGGSNDIANLWPEPSEPRPGFHEKDVVENYLHRQVCNGLVNLTQAQEDIAHNWLKYYPTP